MARSLATATETTSMVTCTDPEAMRRSVEPHGRISSENICLTKIAAALSTAASRSIVEPVSMERTGRGQRSGAIGMMRTDVMSAETNDGMTGDMINIASATVIAMIVGKTAEMTDVTTDVMIGDMTDIVKTVNVTVTVTVTVIVIVIANESEPMTRILRMSAEPRLCEDWTNFAGLATTKIRELRTTTP
jgi:hypothetical protein